MNQHFDPRFRYADNQLFGIGETERRLRFLAAKCREKAAEWQSPRSLRAEVRTRTHPIAFDYRPSKSECYVPGDDLFDQLPIKLAAREEQCRAVGAKVEIGVYHRGTYGSLIDVFVCWMGTETDEPVIL